MHKLSEEIEEWSAKMVTYAAAEHGKVCHALALYDDLIEQIAALETFEDAVLPGWYGTRLGLEFHKDKARLRIPLRTNNEHTAAFVRAVTTLLGVKGIKSVSEYDRTALLVEWTLPDDRVVLVTGYKPQTCQIVQEEVVEVVEGAVIETNPATGEQYVTRKVMKSRLVCDPPEQDEAPAEETA